jgi:hypothetical protein
VADDEITEPTVHLCWSEHAIRRAGEVLRAAGLELMAGHVEAHLPPPAAVPQDYVLVLDILERAHGNAPQTHDELANWLLNGLEKLGWQRPAKILADSAKCAASLTTNEATLRCDEPAGHTGDHIDESAEARWSR